MTQSWFFQFNVVINGPGVPGEHWHCRAVDKNYKIPLVTAKVGKPTKMHTYGSLDVVEGRPMGPAIKVQDLRQYLGSMGCGVGGRCDEVLHDEMMACPGKTKTNFFYGPYAGDEQIEFEEKDSLAFGHLATMNHAVTLSIPDGIGPRDEKGTYEENKDLTRYITKAGLGNVNDAFVVTFVGSFCADANSSSPLALMRTICSRDAQGKVYDKLVDILENENRFRLDNNNLAYRYKKGFEDDAEPIKELLGVYHLYFWQRIMPCGEVFIQTIQAT